MESTSLEKLWMIVADLSAAYGLRIIGALVIVIIGRIVAGILTGVVERLLKKSNTDKTLTKFFTKATKISLVTFVFLAALGTLGIETTSFIAIIAAAGLAIGFALQGSLSNLASGVMLIAFKPFKVGDYIEAGGTSGSVEAIEIFNTILNTPNNKKVIIPNSNITGGNIINGSANDTRRVDLVFGIGYDDDLKKAKDILTRLTNEDDRILKEPATLIAVSELADSSVNFAVRPWVKSSDYWSVLFDLTEKVKLTFDAEGISIPYPQRDVHIHQVDPKG